MAQLDKLRTALTEVGGGDNLNYGTAGFRADAAVLRGAMHRLGALAAIRSRAAGGAAVGAMVTARYAKRDLTNDKRRRK